MKTPKTRKWWVTAVVVLGMFMAILDNSVVSVTLPQIQNAFHTDFQTITWIATIYLLVQAAMIPIVGYLSDRLGARRIFLTALTLFTVGSLLCALAPTKEALMAFRALQAIGTLTPVGSAIIYRTFPPSERSVAVSVITVPILMAPAVGPTIGGYLSTNFNWNAIFVINVPCGIVTLLLAFLVLPRRRLDSRKTDALRSPWVGRARRRFDIAGLLLSMIGFTTLVYGITQAGSMGWSDPTVLLSLLVGAAVLVVFVVVEWEVRDPVIDVRLFTNYTFAIANLLAWMIMALLVGSLFLLPLFFENVQGNTALTTGSFMISQGLATAVGIAIVGKLYQHVGPRILVVSGLLLLIGGTYGLTQIDTSTTGQSLQIWLLLRGLGTGFAVQPLQVLALSVISNKGMAKALSLISVTRQIASALGVGALTTYLTQQATAHTTDISNALKTGLQTHQFTGVAAICVQTVGPTLNQIPVGQAHWLQACLGQHATAMGMADTFWIVMLSYVVCLILALFLGRDPALGVPKQKQAKVPVTESLLPMLDISNAISTPVADGQEVIGSKMLVERYPENSMVHSSQPIVESKPLHAVKLSNAVSNTYDTDQHIVQIPDRLLFGSMQQASSSELIHLQREVLCIIRPHDELMKAPLLLQAFGVSELNAMHYSIAMPKNPRNYHLVEHKEYKEYEKYITWRRKLELYADEITALQTEFDDLCLRMEAHRARVERLSHAINDDLQASFP